MDKIEGYLQVGTNDRGEVVVELDRDHTGHIIFSPGQAVGLANILVKQAKKVAWDGRPFPTIVCLCGSTRFWETFRDVGLKLTLEDKIVLSIGVCAPISMSHANPETLKGRQQKRRLDSLHLRKIELADEVMILNVGGYIGESVARELAYARRLGKTVRFLNEETIAPV